MQIITRVATSVTTSLIAIAKFVTRFSVINHQEDQPTSTENPYGGFVQADWEQIGSDMKKGIISFVRPK